MSRTFKSKVDTWLVAVAIGPGLVIVPMVAFLVWRSGQMTTGTAISLVVTLVFTLGLPLWLFLTTRYEITSDTLRIQAGPLRQQVALKEITKVDTSRSWESAPALSLRRLRVTFANGRTVLISPADEWGFLATLAQAGVNAAKGVSPRD